MGKAGRVACIFTPWALTVASFVCLALIEVAGWNPSTLPDLYFFRANFTDLSIPNADSSLAASLENAKQTVGLAEIYQINLWNYCSSNKSSGVIDRCSGRQTEFYFDPIQVWGLNSTQVQKATGSSDSSLVQKVQQTEQDLENEILGDSGRKALDAYRTVSKWMFIAYQVGFWSTLATIIVSIFAVCSRWGSFFTWILSVVSTLFTFGSVLTSTILFSVLVGALKGVLDKYNVSLTLNTHTLVVAWLGVAFSVAGTLFWLFSVCCCSGRSNPHHRSNQGGLWNAEPKNQGYGDYYGRGRGGMRVEKTGGDYQRVSSPFLGHDSDRVPLNQYPQHPHHGHQNSLGGAFEPYRHD